MEAVESGLYETLQFLFCYLATDDDKAIVAKCREKNLGFICNKCKSKCPYGLDTPTLLAKNYEGYKRVLSGEIDVRNYTR